MRRIALFVACLWTASGQGQERNQRFADLEKQLTEAKASIATLQKTVESLSSEMQSLRQTDRMASVVDAPRIKKGAGEQQADPSIEFADRMIGAENGSNEHDNELKAKPEVFIQTRYSVAPIEGSGTAFDPNLRLSRIETRWAGKINDRLGAGVEIQFQESVEGSPGAHSSAAELFVSYRLAGRQNIYARYNQFNGDPVTGMNIRAFDFGYFVPVGELSRLSFDYQFKNHPSFEDDAINGRFQITWGILLK